MRKLIKNRELETNQYIYKHLEYLNVNVFYFNKFKSYCKKCIKKERVVF